jgi:hypothetical protein
MRTKRIEGFGKGKSMDFPTINIELPLGSVELGLWSVLTNFGPAMGLFSNYNGMIRGEIHVIDLKYLNSIGRVSVNLDPGKEFELEFISKLRDPIKIKDIKETIQNDKKLAYDFWKGSRTCNDCSRCYKQDYGYSNWTVEGTNYGCYVDVWEEDSSSDYFERNLKYRATNCKYFDEGDCWDLDVDGNYPGPTDEWIKQLKRDIKLIDLLD